MKISKKLLSLLLCMTMLVSATAFASMTSAPQTDAKDLAWFTEPFSASGQSITKRGESTASNASEFYTVGTFDYVLRDGSTDDYVLNLSVSVNNTSKSNYAGVRKTAATNTYFSLADGMFSVSYDICFKSAPASGAVFRISGQNVNQSGSKPWGIGRTIFEGVSDNDKHIGLWDEQTDYKIDLNRWYSVKHLFDTKVGYEYMTVTDETGEVISISPQALGTSLLNAAGIYMIDLSSWKACEYSIDNITLKDESVSLEATADTFLIRTSETYYNADDVTLIATIPEGFDKAVVMTNGSVKGQITPVSGKNVYDITIPADELGLGNHELILSASYSDGITRTNATTVKVMKEYEAAVLSYSGTHPTDVEDFNSLWDPTFVLSDGKQQIAYNYIEKNTTSWQGNAASYLIPGESGLDGDYAILTNTKNSLFQIRNLPAKDNPPISKGEFVIEFDILLPSSSTDVTINNLGTGSWGNFILANKIFSSISISENVWTHVKLVRNADGTALTAYANGQEVTKTAAVNWLYNSSSPYTGYFRFTLKNEASFAIDNARIYNVVTDPVINSAAYVTANGETETTGAVPADATAIKLNMSEALDVTSEDVIIWADGEYMQPEDVSSSDGVVTITLPELEANTDLTVVLADTIDGVSAKLAHSFYVTDSGSFFKTAGVVTSGNTATAVIRHMGSGTSNAIVAAYKGNQLVSINVCDFKSAADIGAVNVSASTAGADEIKIMAWNTLSSATPKMTAASYPIN